MAELTSFPINTKTFEELEIVTDAQATDADGVLLFDESVGVMKRMTRGELFKGKVIPIDNISVFSGLDTDSFSDRQQFHLNSFAPDGESGGGPLLWNPDLPKSLHDGVRYFSPTVPIPADFDNPTDVQNYMDGVGEEWPAGDGVFVLTLFSIQSSESPAVDGAIVLFDGVSGNTVKNGPVPSAIGTALIESPNITAVSYLRLNADETVSARTLAEHKTDLSINNVDNTSDASKPISTATQVALDNIDDDVAAVADSVDALSNVVALKAATTYVDAADENLQDQIDVRVQSVATIADLRLISGATDGQQASVDGIIFTAVSSDTTSTDNSVSVVVDTDGMRWYNYNELQVSSLTSLAATRGVIGDQLVNVFSSDGGVYKWGAASTETSDGDRVVSVSGVATGRWLKVDSNALINTPTTVFTSSSGSGTITIPVTLGASDNLSSISGRQKFDIRRDLPCVITPPTGLGWNPPCSVWRERGGAIKTDFDVRNYRYWGNGTYECLDPINGNEANDGLTWATAKRDMNVAINTRTNATIYIAPGTYHRSDFHDWGTARISRNVSIICPNGIAKVTRRAGGASLPAFTLDTGTTYVVARNNIQSVFDAYNYDEYGDYLWMPAYASLALLNAADYGYFRDGANTYVKRIDGLQPDYLNTAIFLIESQFVSGQTGNTHVYMENIWFEGGNSCYDIDPTAANDVMKYYAKNCSYKYSTATGGGGDGLSVFGATEIMLQDCFGARTFNDVVSYHEDSVTSPGLLGRALEVDCTWRRAGEDNQPSSNNNGSTGHDGWTIVRINTQNYLNGGPQVADVTGCKSWLVGVNCYDAAGAGSVDGIQCGEGEMWIDSSSVYNVVSDALLTNSGGTIHLRDCDIEGDIAANGGTVIDTY